MGLKVSEKVAADKRNTSSGYCCGAALMVTGSEPKEVSTKACVIEEFTVTLPDDRLVALKLRVAIAAFK